MARKGKFLILSALLATVLGISSPGGASEPDSASCLECHADAGTVGEAFRIAADAFAATAHGDLGCAACHEGVADTHPDDGITPSKAHCQNCHQEVAEAYSRTEHATNANCGDCHNPHLVRGPTQVSGYDMNRQCAACHQTADMTAAHEAWLPQAELHLESLPCISCHTGSKDYVINLFISKRRQVSGADLRGVPFNLASFGELQAIAGDREISSLIDPNGDGQVSLAELREFNSSPKLDSFRLQGMLSPQELSHSLQILDNRWDCTFCHASGPEAMQTSFVSLPLENGGYRRLPVEEGAILDALNGTPDFYMLGATRNKVLDLIGLGVIAGGLVMPVGHGTLRFLTRKNRR